MVVVESITLVPNQRLPLSVSNDANYPDLDLSNQQTKDYETDVLYNAQSNQTVQYPAVVQPPGDALLTVKLSGIPNELVGQNVWLSPNYLDYCALSSKFQLVPSGATDIDFQMSLQLRGSTPMTSPWSIKGMIQFTLFVANTGAYKDQPAPVPLELYTLGARLPAYFDGGVPLLLLRMFLPAATQQQVTTPQQWVALVVKICHGSAHPETGIASQTENHWLKYDTMIGRCNFVEPNDYNPAHLASWEQWNQFGGYFFLTAWLNAYRIYKKSKTCLSLVNCYDQAGAVEVALSLGISHASIAWEYHSPYGFITKDANLVGWGECNSPYFEKVPANKVLGEKDATRTYFGNHVFLSWNPTSDLEPSDFESTNDPSDYPGMFAIDACAGPHLGNEDRGVWVSPTSYPKGYTSKDTTYWRKRDDQYPSSLTNRLRNLENQHVWTPGVTGLKTPNLDRHFKPLNTDPFEGSTINFPLATSFPSPNSAFGGSIGDLETLFLRSLVSMPTGCSNWAQVLMPKIPFASNGITFEAKFYDATQPAFNFASMKVSVLPSLPAALSAQRARAAQVIITSTLEASDFHANMATPSEGQEVYVLQADFTGLMVCMNLFIEVIGYVGVDVIKALVSVLETYLGSVRTVDSTQWLSDDAAFKEYAITLADTQWQQTLSQAK